MEAAVNASPLNMSRKNGAVSFSEDSDFWITGIDGLSSNEITISETQGVNQIGSTPLVPVGTAQGPSRSRAYWKPKEKTGGRCCPA